MTNILTYSRCSTRPPLQVQPADFERRWVGNFMHNITRYQDRQYRSEANCMESKRNIFRTVPISEVCGQWEPSAHHQLVPGWPGHLRDGHPAELHEAQHLCGQVRGRGRGVNCNNAAIEEGQIKSLVLNMCSEYTQQNRAIYLCTLY